MGPCAVSDRRVRASSGRRTVRRLGRPRSGEVGLMAERSASTYRLRLEEAQELGRLDGRWAAAFEPLDAPIEPGGRCLGRTPAEFAWLLWENRPGNPPKGLELNAP